MRIKVIAKYILIFISIFFIGCASTPKWAPNLPEDIGVAGDEKLGSVLEYIRDSYDFPALGAMLIVGGEIVEAEAIGVRKLGTQAQKNRDVGEILKFLIDYLKIHFIYPT